MKIFIANFPFQLTEEEISDLFRIFGEVTGCKMVKDPKTCKSRDYGFVEFRKNAHGHMAMVSDQKAVELVHGRLSIGGTWKIEGLQPGSLRINIDRQPSYLNFDGSAYAWKPDIDYRRHPERYRVGKGEQGVLICEPYKSELGQYWRFKTKAIAAESSERIWDLFADYLKAGDFVGADMPRKYFQMGYTRAHRYANYKGGKKYDEQQGYALSEGRYG